MPLQKNAKITGGPAIRSQPFHWFLVIFPVAVSLTQRVNTCIPTTLRLLLPVMVLVPQPLYNLQPLLPPVE